MTASPTLSARDRETPADPEPPDADGGDIVPRIPGIFVRSLEDHVVSFEALEQSTASDVSSDLAPGWSLSGDATLRAHAAVADAVRTAGGGLEVRFRGPNAAQSSATGEVAPPDARARSAIGALGVGETGAGETGAGTGGGTGAEGSSSPLAGALVRGSGGRRSAPEALVARTDAGRWLSCEGRPGELAWALPPVWVEGPGPPGEVCAGSVRVIVGTAPSSWPVLAVTSLTVGGARERTVRWPRVPGE